jgi:hypothetical protein
MGKRDAGEPGRQRGSLELAIGGQLKIGVAGVPAGERPGGFTVPYVMNRRRGNVISFRVGARTGRGRTSF